MWCSQRASGLFKNLALCVPASWRPWQGACAAAHQRFACLPLWSALWPQELGLLVLFLLVRKRA